ncbi:MAG: glycosyltransferase [Candidatus Sumerlaeaceae bacterium]|nr:glycosyltransferase [Candidatus Sumerlaeaceae bacterium]
MTALQVSVVIPVYNRKAEVEECLKSVLAQSVAVGAPVEILCVDNGSTDGTREALERWPVRVVDCVVRGVSAARNTGLRAAVGDIVAMIDSDCVAAEGWLGRLVEPFSDPEVLAAGGRIEAYHVECGPALWAASYKVLDQERFFRGEYLWPPFFATANAAFRREALMRIGGFDESLRAGEDADAVWRLLDLGGRLAYCPEALVRHRHRETVADFYAQSRGYGAACVDVFARYRERFGVRGVIHWDSVRALATLPWRIAWFALFGPTPWERRKRVYEAVWRTGFTLAAVQRCIERRVLYL